MKAEPPAARGAAGTELARCLEDPGYTPPRRALSALIAVLDELPEEQAKVVERAIARAGETALEAALAAFEPGAAGPGLLRLFERLASECQDRRLFEPLAAALEDRRPHRRKLAARALGKLHDERAEAPLIAALGRAADGPERKSIVDALGALGGTETLTALEGIAGDADLERRAARARLLVERRLARELPAQLALDAALDAPVRVELSCRAGLSAVLASELASGWAPVVAGPSAVVVEHRGTLGELLAARTALELALLVPLANARETEPAERIAEALTRGETLALFQRWTRGRARFRLAWTLPGHRRALQWAVAQAVRRRTQALINDSRAALWTVRAAPDASGELRLVPRLDPDPRFGYRLGAVRAASHPTIAAALARFAAARPDDVVWDPFVGSGLELAEIARLGSVRALWGSDVDAAALDVARANLEAAGVAARLRQADALGWAPDGVSLIVTNPPMGRRLARDGSLEALLTGFVRHAARVLRDGGRLVWLSPLAEKTARAARAAGLDVDAGPDVDLGGFVAQLQTLTRSARET